jgi:SAM-dependent methyltransferase
MIGLLLLSCLGARAAELPRVAVLYSSFREGSCSYRNEYDADLARLGWPVERFENTELDRLLDRLDRFDLVIGTAVYNYEHPADLAAAGERLRRFVRHGGVLLLTDTNYEPQVGWLPALEPGLTIEVTGEQCAADGQPAAWTEVRHPLLRGLAAPPAVWTHPQSASGLWQVLAKCGEGRPILLCRELGDGVIIASCIYRQYGFPHVPFLQNLWLWARDEPRIMAARQREEDLYQAARRPRELETRSMAAPVIDGMVEEESWNGAAATDPFLTVDGAGLARQATTAILGRDDYYLYVAFRCADSDPGALRTLTTRRDGAVYHDDCVELFVDPTGRRESYRHFIVNAAGVVYDEATIDPAWDGWWQAAVQRHPRGWSAELRIPLVMLGDPLTFGDEWAVNFARHAPRTGELSAWSPTYGPFGTPANFGRLTNAKLDPNRCPVRISRCALEGRRLSLALTKPSYGDFGGRFIVECVSPTGTLTETTREFTVQGYGSTLVETEHQMAAEGVWTVRARLEDGGGPVWISEPLRREVGPPLAVALPDQAYRNAVYRTGPGGPRLRVVATVRDPLPGLALNLRVTGEAVDARREVAVDESGTVEATFATEAWPVGQYTLVTVLQDGARELARDRRTVVVMPPPTGSEVVVDAEGITYVDGEPFLPLGLYHVSEPVADLITAQNAGMGLPPLTLETMLDDVAARGFNCFVRGWGMPSRPFLDLAHARGLKVMPEIGGMSAEAVREAVRAGRDHPALLLWYGVDEPGGERLQHSLDVRAVFTEEDPHHPVGAALNNPGVMPEAARALDVLMPDPYPVPRAPFSMVTVFTHAAERARAPGQSLWVVPQAFAVHGVWREPTPEELRNMTYQALVGGARGLIWYAYYTTEANEAFGMPRNPQRKQWWYPETPLWDYHAGLNSELLALRDVILAPGGEPLLTSDDAVRALLRRTTTRTVVLAVNTTPDPRDARITLPSGTQGEVEVLGEERTVAAEESALADRFEGLAVHVYETTPAR